MKYMIDELWNGNLKPCEKCGAGDKEIAHLIMLMEKNKGLLYEQLGENERSILEKYMDCAEDYANSISLCAFRDGFHLATKLMAEAMYKD